MTFAKVIQVVDEQIAEYRAAIAQLTAAKSTLAAEKKPSDPTPGEPTPVLRKRRFFLTDNLLLLALVVPSLIARCHLQSPFA